MGRADRWEVSSRVGTRFVQSVDHVHASSITASYAATSAFSCSSSGLFNSSFFA
jgi:hypothetical protein